MEVINSTPTFSPPMPAVCHIIIRHCGGIKHGTVTLHGDCFQFVYFFHPTFLSNSAFSLHDSTPFILSFFILIFRLYSVIPLCFLLFFVSSFA